MQSIDNPEVNALMNSYQSALSHYMAGFVYEALGETSCLGQRSFAYIVELKKQCWGGG